jgi:hypothetical protein
MALLASATRFPLCRHKVGAILISSGRLKTVDQPAKRVQLQLTINTLEKIALVSRHVLDVSRMDQKHFQTMLFENLKRWHPPGLF